MGSKPRESCIWTRRRTLTTFPEGSWLWRTAFPLLAAIAPALGHHYFNAWLEGKAARPIAVNFGTAEDQTFGGQEWALTLGILFAIVFRVVLTYSVNSVFAPMFWTYLEGRVVSVKNAGRIFSSQGTSPQILPLKTPFPYRLVIVILLISVPALSPPSLTAANGIVSAPCIVTTVSLANSRLGFVSPEGGFGPVHELVGLAIQVVTGGSYVHSIDAGCGKCEYNLTFYGPNLQCEERESIATLPTAPQGSRLLWYSTLDKISQNQWDLVAASQNGESQELDIVSCHVVNATYSATVRQDVVTEVRSKFSSRQEMSATAPTNQIRDFNAMLDALAVALNGSIIIHPDSSFQNPASLALHGPLVKFDNGVWSLHQRLSDALPEVMKNLTISLLSRNIGRTALTQSPVETVCLVDMMVYDYDWKRLAGTYVTAYGLSLICVMFALWYCYGRRSSTAVRSVKLEDLLWAIGGIEQSKQIEVDSDRIPMVYSSR
jgi:hypothetical protein